MRCRTARATSGQVALTIVAADSGQVQGQDGLADRTCRAEKGSLDHGSRCDQVLALALNRLGSHKKGSLDHLRRCGSFGRLPYAGITFSEAALNCRTSSFIRFM